MYLISWMEEDAILEASLGGRVTQEEMEVVYEELRQLLAEVESQPFLFVVDYSRAKAFDGETSAILHDIKEFCRRQGAEKVVSVVREEDDIPWMTSACLQQVLEGKEDFVTDPSVINWTPTVAYDSPKRLAA